MTEATLRKCELLIENRDKVKSVFKHDGNLMNLICAEIYTDKGKTVDTDVLKNVISCF